MNALNASCQTTLFVPPVVWEYLVLAFDPMEVRVKELIGRGPQMCGAPYRSRKSGFASPIRSFAPFQIVPLSRFMPTTLSLPRRVCEQRTRTSNQSRVLRFDGGVRKRTWPSNTVQHANAIDGDDCPKSSQSLRQVRRGHGWGETRDVQPLPYNSVGIRIHSRLACRVFRNRMIEIAGPDRV